MIILIIEFWKIFWWLNWWISRDVPEIKMLIPAYFFSLSSADWLQLANIVGRNIQTSSVLEKVIFKIYLWSLLWHKLPFRSIKCWIPISERSWTPVTGGDWGSWAPGWGRTSPSRSPWLWCSGRSCEGPSGLSVHLTLLQWLTRVGFWSQFNPRDKKCCKFYRRCYSERY